MLFGMRGHDFGRYTPQALVALYHRHKVQAVQMAVPKAIEGMGSYTEVDDTLLAQLDGLLRDAGVAVPVLGCYIEPSLADEDARLAQVAEFKAGIRAAAALGAGCIGTETTAFPYGGDEALRAQAFDRLCRSLEDMLAEAQRHSVTVAVEPVALHTLNSPALTEKLLRRFEGSGLAIIFDAVNLLTPYNINEQQALWRECLAVFGHKIMAIHVKDTRPEGDWLAGCALGEGVMEFGPVIAPWLQENKPGIALLREETSLTTVESDLAWMRGTFQPA